MMLLGRLIVELPNSDMNCLDRLLFEFAFGEIEIGVTVKSESTGKIYSTQLELDI